MCRSVLIVIGLMGLIASQNLWAASDAALANAADICNAAAYNILKPQRDKPGARDLMGHASKGKKYAKWMKKYIKLLDLCKAKPYMSDCEPASKIDGYKAKLEENKKKMEENMLNNYLCSAPYVNNLAAKNTSAAKAKPEIAGKVEEFLKAAKR